MQNLGELSNWSLLGVGDRLHVPATASGKVTLRVNAEKPVRLFYTVRTAGVKVKDELQFLCVVDGLDEVAFRIEKDIVVASDGPVFYQTNAGLVFEPVVAGESFFRIVERRQMSPEVAAVVARANANERARVQQLRGFMQEQRAAMAALTAKLNQPSDAPKPAKKSKALKNDEHSASTSVVDAAASGNDGQNVGTGSSAPASGNGDGSNANGS